jgi:hypothetical protein
MRRREFIALTGATVAWPFAAMAQQTGRTYRLGVLSASPRSIPASVAMIDELRRLSFIEGQNLTIDYRNFAQHVDLISEYAAELVKAKPDVIYAGQRFDRGGRRTELGSGDLHAARGRGRPRPSMRGALPSGALAGGRTGTRQAARRAGPLRREPAARF